MLDAHYHFWQPHTVKPSGGAIEIEGLGVCHDGRWVLRSFSMRVMAGEKVTLSGPSGAGKSTVLKCILGLVVPQEGEIRVGDRKVDGHGVWEIRRTLAYVAQEPALGPGTARQVIENPFTYRANSALRGNLERLPELLEHFNLPGALLDKDMATLSGGEKQRVALISALLLERSIILLDEATSALDRANREAVGTFFEQAAGVTVLSVAHDSESLGFCNRVVNVPGTASERGGR